MLAALAARRGVDPRQPVLAAADHPQVAAGDRDAVRAAARRGGSSARRGPPARSRRAHAGSQRAGARAQLVAVVAGRSSDEHHGDSRRDRGRARRRSARRRRRRRARRLRPPHAPGRAVTVDASAASPGSVGAPPGAAAPRATIRSGSRDRAADRGGARGAAEVARRRVAVVRRPSPSRAPTTASSSARERRRAARDGARRRLGELRPQLRLVALALERHLAGQREVQHAAERVHVGARVDAAAADLLGRDVVERPDPLARCASRRCASAPAWRARSPSGRRGRPVDEQVRRLDVAVDEPGRVDRVERRAGLRDDVAPRAPARARPSRRTSVRRSSPST